MDSFFNLPLVERIITILLITVCLSFLFWIFSKFIRLIKFGGRNRSITLGTEVSDEDISKIADIDIKIIKIHQWFAKIDYLKTKKIMDNFDLLSEKMIIELKSNYNKLKESILKAHDFENGLLSTMMNNQETRFYYLVQEMQKEKLSKKVRSAMCRVNLAEFSTDKNSVSQLSELEQYVERYVNRWMNDIDSFYKDNCYDLRLPTHNQINKMYEKDVKKNVRKQLLNLFYSAKEIHKDFESEAERKEEEIKIMAKEKVKLRMQA